MSGSVLVLSEQALGLQDARQLVALHAPDVPDYRVLVPADTHRNLLADVLDRLSLLELREALEAARGHDELTRAEAAQALSISLAQLRAAGAQADGEVVIGDPLRAVEAALAGSAVAGSAVEEVVVVTRLHAVEDTFHQDWASKARARLGVPVLHVYAGSSWVG